MGRERRRLVVRFGLLALTALLLIVAVGCRKKETVASKQVVTARFTSPVDIESQPSPKCIACHTKTNPINKLATPTSAAAETGG